MQSSSQLSPAHVTLLAVSINLCDQDEYPATMAIHGRCVSMIADMWHAPSETNEQGERQPAQGVATTGSSEALMLAALAMKKVWQHKRKDAGKSFKEVSPLERRRSIRRLMRPCSARPEPGLWRQRASLH